MIDKSERERFHEDFGEVTKEVAHRYILGSGEEITEETHRICAKMHVITQNEKQTNFCYVKFFRGKMFDPQGIDATKVRLAEFRKVNETVFNLYFNYLKTKNGESLVRAEREHIHV